MQNKEKALGKTSAFFNFKGKPRVIPVVTESF